MSLEIAFYIGIFSGAIWATIMDSAFPHVFDRLPKPFGCSKCMAFWSALVASFIYAVTGHGIIPIFAVIGAGAVAHVTAAFASRTFRGQ
jgi:hypothetical protein